MVGEGSLAWKNTAGRRPHDLRVRASGAAFGRCQPPDGPRPLPPGGGAFPLPEILIEYGEECLRQIAKLGFRAPTAVAATRRMLDDGVLDAAGHGDPARLDHDYLLSLKGIGPYAAAHCRMLLHDFSRIPVDSVVVAHLRERHATTPEAFIAARAECGIYLGLGYRLMRLKEKFQVAQIELAPPSQRPESAY